MPGAQTQRSDGEEIYKGAPVGERKSWLLTRQRPEGWQVLRDGANFEIEGAAFCAGHFGQIFPTPFMPYCI